MDSFKLGLFLMVIVSGAALGSGPITSKEDTKLPSKSKKRNGPKHDASSLIKRSFGPGDVISGVQLTVDVLTKILEVLGDIERKIAIGVENKMGEDWEALNVYFSSGTSDVPLPNEVRSGKAFLYDGRKTKGPVARGCVGAIAYYIPDLDKTLSVMFSVPFDYNLYSNWWDVTLTDGKSKADESTLYNKDNGDPFEGDNGWHDKRIGSSFKVRGSMASSGTPTLEIHVMRD